MRQAKRTNPGLVLCPSVTHRGRREADHFKHCVLCVVFEEYVSSASKAINRSKPESKPKPQPANHPHRSPHSLAAAWKTDGTPSAYPFHSDSHIKEQNQTHRAPSPLTGTDTRQIKPASQQQAEKAKSSRVGLQGASPPPVAVSRLLEALQPHVNTMTAMRRRPAPLPSPPIGWTGRRKMPASPRTFERPRT
jgi:hypothetical protein